jgi:endonuclease/exonuclease/phosphatase family metal-dependent hydrolase
MAADRVLTDSTRLGSDHLPVVVRLRVAGA